MCECVLCGFNVSRARTRVNTPDTMSSLEAAARDWLSEPVWNKLFKNSFDVVEDQLHRGLVALAALALAVNFLANLPSGELLCIVVDIVNSSQLQFADLAGPFHASLASYAAQEPTCRQNDFETQVVKVAKISIELAFVN